MKSIPELEKDYDERLRNLDLDTHGTISASPNLSEKYIRAEYRLYREAHVLYWHIQALKGDPRVIMHHPV